MNPDSPCPCCSGAPHQDCCQPFLAGDQFPTTAAQLMRSRYAAYALQLIPYLVETVTQDKKADHQPASLQGWASSVTFTRLDILHTEAGKEEDSTGTVDFQAWYLEKGRLECLREKSLFFKEEGRWKYSHGTHAKAQIGRNDACPCASGKKYKKCHG